MFYKPLKHQMVLVENSWEPQLSTLVLMQEVIYEHIFSY